VSVLRARTIELEALWETNKAQLAELEGVRRSLGTSARHETDTGRDRGPTVIESAPRRSLRVLSVDDQPALAQMVRHMLAPEGHVVVTCGSGEEALALLEEERFDVVVSDVGMAPG
jgi:PleD family two-component response regulator